jgi:hypothetical protein
VNLLDENMIKLKKNTGRLLDASKEFGLEVIAERIK